MYSISAFSPAYTDEHSIGTIVQTTAQLLPKLTSDYEIVVANDGLADGTGDLRRTLTAENPYLKVIQHGMNRGYSAAFITEFANCSKDLIFYTDGDGQYDVEELPRLLAVFLEKQFRKNAAHFSYLQRVLSGGHGDVSALRNVMKYLSEAIDVDD
jgi:glycosyltransferase involved in cell wall biosynthesis